jgi:hypothetical protein
MRTRLAAAALAAAALLTLSACSSDSGGDEAHDRTAPTTAGMPTAPTTAPSAVATTGAGKSVPGLPPEPTGAGRTVYLAALTAVDPALGADAGKAVDDGRNQCTTLDTGGRNPDHSAAERFGSGTHPLTDAQGKAINAALRLTLCPEH